MAECFLCLLIHTMIEHIVTVEVTAVASIMKITTTRVKEIGVCKLIDVLSSVNDRKWSLLKIFIEDVLEYGPFEAVLLL